MKRKKDCPHTKNDTQTIVRNWSVADEGKEIAKITMSVTATPDFQAESIEKLLQAIAGNAHSFYLEVGNTLKTKP